MRDGLNLKFELVQIEFDLKQLKVWLKMYEYKIQMENLNWIDLNNLEL